MEQHWTLLKAWVAQQSVAALGLPFLDIFTLLLPFRMELFVGFSAIPSSEAALSSH